MGRKWIYKNKKLIIYLSQSPELLVPAVVVVHTNESVIGLVRGVVNQDLENFVGTRESDRARLSVYSELILLLQFDFDFN